MRYLPIAVGLSAIALVGMSATVLLDCAPSAEDTSVEDNSKCEPEKLPPPPSPEATVKLYLDTSNDLLARARDLEGRFQAICNKITQPLGISPGSDLQAACGKISVRLAKIQAASPKPDGGVKLPRVRVRWSEACFADGQAEAACAAQCSTGAGCDATGACPSGALVGKCNGKCTGVCEVVGAGVPCRGACIGTCNMPDASAIDSGLASCEGECIGKCAGKTWTGRCAGPCNTGFLGQCLGTCTGTCDGLPIGPVPDDAGSDAAPMAPGGQDGNCPGRCSGQCSSRASGTCTSACGADFLGGTCRGGGSCTGGCNASETACLDTCTGICRNNPAGGQCDGVCVGKCEGQLTMPTCRAEVACPGINAECKLICGVRGALAAKCPVPPTPEILLVDDWAFYDAIRPTMAEFAQVINELNLVLASANSLADRTPADYKAIGVRTTRAFACALQANKTITDALASLQRAKVVADSLNPPLGGGP